MRWFLLGPLILLEALHQATWAQVLTPPMFNLAEGRNINATATCGVLNGRPIRERYCFLAGATSYSPFAIGSFSYDNDFAELRVGSSPSNENQERNKDVVEGGQSCSVCDSSVPEISHPAENMVDGSPRWWQSPPLSRGMEYNQVNITIDLEQEFHVAYVSIIMANSPRPGLWVLERSTDYGDTYKAWQYFAENPSQCEEFFGSDSLQPIMDDDSVICSTDYSQIVPLENGQIYVTLLNDRPGRVNFSHSETLQDFTKATNVRLRLLRTKTLQGHLMDLNDKKDPTITRRYFYAIKEIEMGGRCVCNGHAQTCDILDTNRPTRLLCRCEHNTCGDQCDKCCSGFEQKQWQPNRDRQIFRCEPCNCFGHSEDCSYDVEVDKQGGSLDIHGNRFGGGVCRNCRDNTNGTNCDQCAFGFYRPHGRLLNASNACEPCQCDPHYHTGACEEGSGECACRANFLAPDCRACSVGHYDFPECKPCDCHLNGTAEGVCLPESGACPCKDHFGGTFCDKCMDGFFGFPTCNECRCADLGAVNKNCSKESGECQCKINYGGQTCELCADGYFDHPSCSYCDCDHSGTLKEVCDKSNGKCFCKPGYAGDRCDRCNDTFYGYPDCKPCNCDMDGSGSALCQANSGQCQCKPNFTGRKCNKCSPGFYDYPKCSACQCDQYGAHGITCNDQGLCFCKFNFDGAKCEKCKQNFYNYPLCEECNCDRRGISRTFPGCDKVPVGELCSCKQRVMGRTCNECKPTFWNLQAYNEIGCQECSCNVHGTLSMLSDCDDVSGQCQCKAHVSGRECTDCKPGYFALQSWNAYGCQPCTCDIGGSFSSICDKKTGQCHCKPKITGQNCTEPIKAHYFPTLMHLQYEAEDGRTPDNREVRFATDATLFPDYSWRGYAVFSPIQDEIILTVQVAKPSLYRLVFHYINPTMSDIPVEVELKPFYTNSHAQDDVKQKVEAKIPVSKEPKSVYISKNGNGTPYPFVLNPGHWSLHIRTKPRLLLDYVALFPATYFEGTVLRHHIRNPCLLDDAALKETPSSQEGGASNPACKKYSYPKLNATSSTATIGQLMFEQDGSKSAAPENQDQMVAANLGPTVFLNQPVTYSTEIPIPKPGNYVVVIDYSNFNEEVYPINVELGANGVKQEGLVNFHYCPYSQFCREVVSALGQPLPVPSPEGKHVKVSLKPVHNISVHLGPLIAIPQMEFTVDYLLPKSQCIIKNGKCQGSEFLMPPGSVHFEVETDPDRQIAAENLSKDPSDSHGTILSILNGTNDILDVRGEVPNPDHYVIVVHYYSPNYSNVDLDILMQTDKQIDGANASANAQASMSYCPSIAGCRTVLRRLPQDTNIPVTSYPIMKKFALKFFLKNPQQSVFLDYVMPVPLNNFADDILEPLSSQRSSEFLSKCQQMLLRTNASEYDEYCKKQIFSLTSDYNMGALACHCDEHGSLSFKCDQFGGQCPCKANVIGRTCSMCKPGFFGFPDCRQCNCLQGQQCDPKTGQCLCPLHVEGQTCDQCKPYAFGYDSLIGCQECECNTYGTQDGTAECDPLLGQCKCKDNVGGRKCDKCLAGYYAFSHCVKCSCNLAGSMPDICNQTSAECSCKPNVQGYACDACAAGTFSLEATNPKGCTDCFCFGVTNQCRSSNFVKTTIHEMINWTSNGLGEVKSSENHIEFAPIGESPLKPFKGFYMLAPEPYLGKLLNSYGGKLTYKVASKTDGSSSRLLSPEVLLKSVNETIEFSLDDELPAEPGIEFEVSCPLIPEKWKKNDEPISRQTLMHILNNVTALMIKVSFYDKITSARLIDVKLDSADEEQNKVGDEAINIEICACPEGYTGNSCEQCDDGFFRATSAHHSSGSHALGPCIPCQCNGHSSTCDKATGQCSDCQHDTKGEHCDECQVGLYGDATRGQATDCRVCPCPLPVMQNNFASSCIVNEVGQLHSCECRQGYAGISCDMCDVGWFGEPTAYGGFCLPCSCNSNNNLTVPGSCDPLTGVCSLCQQHTMGNKCEICQSWFFGDAVESKDCKACMCDQCGSHHCNHTSGQCHCKPNVKGENCDRCIANAYGFSECHGCKMCECSVASTSPQCDLETGLCQCQPGVVGNRCEQCDQGFWNFRESGCIKCDCEADLSLGTVCDVRTGQCHCMDGATGPRCDQCIDGYLRVPDYGCRFCDQCVHVLVQDLQSLDDRMVSLETEIGDVSLAYLTNRRLEKISDALQNVKASAHPFLNRTADEAALDAKKAGDKLKASIDDAAIKSKRLESSSNKTFEQTRSLASKTQKVIDDLQSKFEHINAMVRKLQELSGSLQSGVSTTEYRNQLISQANTTLDELKRVDFSKAHVLLKNISSEAEKMSKHSESESDNQTHIKTLIANMTRKIGSFMENMDHVQNLQRTITPKTYEIDQWNDLSRKHPFLGRNLNFDREVDLCAQKMANYSEYRNLTTALMMDAHDYFESIKDLNDTVSDSLPKLVEKADELHSNMRVAYLKEAEVKLKTQEIEDKAQGVTRKFDGVKANSNRAVQAADSYNNTASAVNKAFEASQQASQKAQEAETNSQGIAQKSTESNMASMEMLRTATKNRATVVNELKNEVNQAKEKLKTINSTLGTSNQLLGSIQINRDRRLELGNREVLTQKILKDAESVRQNANSVQEKMSKLKTQLDNVNARTKGGVGSKEAIQLSSKHAAAQINHLNATIPSLEPALSRLQTLQAKTNRHLQNVTELLKTLRDSISRARDLANRIRVGVHFGPTSSLQLNNPDKLARTSAHTSLSLHFTTREPNGFLLFLGNELGTNQTTRSVPTDDYLALQVIDGLPTLTYDLGDGPTSVQVTKVVSDDKWHKLSVERTGKVALFSVESSDGTLVQNNVTSKQNFSVLNIDQEQSKIFLGGLPDTARVPSTIKSRHFVGQIEDVVFHGQQLGLWNFAHNGSKNVDPAEARQELRAKIPEDGVLLSGEGFVEMDRNNWNPRREGSLKMDFKTLSSSGLLFYLGGKEKDFLSLELRQGHVLAHYNLGSGRAEVMSNNRYDDGQTHSIDFSRSGKSGMLVIDKEEHVNKTGPGMLNDLDVAGDSYFIGGLKNPVPQIEVTRQSFYGCISNLYLGDQPIPFAKQRASFHVELGCPERPIRIVSFEPSSISVGVQAPKFDLIDVTFKMKPMSPTSFVTALIIQGKVIFLLALESNQLVLRSYDAPYRTLKVERNFTDGAWHYVTLTRSQDKLTLGTDDMQLDMDSGLDTSWPLHSLGAVMHFGSMPGGSSIPDDARAASFPFHGCIGDVSSGTNILDFTNATRMGRGAPTIGCPLPDPSPDLTDGKEMAGAADQILDSLRLPLALTPAEQGACVHGHPLTDPLLANADILGSRFGLEPYSRIEFDVDLNEAFETRCELDIQFRTTTNNGILLFAAHRVQSDFVALYLKNGHLVFSFDSGSGLNTLTSRSRFVDFKWHTVTAYRDERHANLSIDGQREAKLNFDSSSHSIDVQRPLFIGGYALQMGPSAKKVLPNIANSFGGCLRDFKLNKASLNDPAATYGTVPCNDLRENGSFFGARGGYLILQDNFYVGSTFSLEMDIKPRNDHSVLLAIASMTKGGDYLNLQMLDGVLKFTVNNGAGPQTVNLSLGEDQSFCDGHWHSIKIYKTKNLLTISADGSSKFFVIKQQKSTDTNTKDPLYLGGLPNDYSHHSLDTRDAFHGCIRKITMGKKPRRKKDLDISQLEAHGDVIRDFCPNY